MLLRSGGHPDVGYAHGVVQLLLSGNFLYNSPGNPSNLSVFCFYEKLRDGSENEQKLLLHVMAKDGKERSTDEIKNSLKQVVVAPSNYTQMKDQLMIFREVTKIFFGSKSKLPESLKEVCKVIVSNASRLKYKCKDDKLLPAKTFLVLMRRFNIGSNSVS